MKFPLPVSTPEQLALDPAAIERLLELVSRHVAEGRYPGAQLAIARHGKLALTRTFGDARLDPKRVAARDDSLWLLYSNTKVLTACAVWLLAERGALAFTDTVASHVPGFEANGKGEITIIQLLTHQAGFPNADMPAQAWDDHELLRKTVCEYTLEWAPGSRVHYHGRAAHWTAAAMIEAITKTDYRTFIREEIVEPLALGDDVFVGLPDSQHERSVDMHEPGPDGRPVKRVDENNAAFRRAGTPGGGGYATARGMAAFYQMLLAGGALGGVRVLSPRVIQYATRNHSGERADGPTGIAQHRGMTPATRGTTPTIRGLGTIASPSTFGHGGAGSSYSWGDPESGLSFTYLSNARLDGDWHNRRLDQVSSLVHSALVEL
jgi:CubicO group peptidase (beta-lactamase class C family)